MMEDILKKQIIFQNFLGNDIKTQDFKNQMFYSMMFEIAECANETPWKTWKKNQKPVNKEKYVNELVDIQIFLLNLLVAENITWAEFEDLIRKKQAINIERQQNGY